VQLAPAADSAALDIRLAGQAVSRNVGYNRGVTIYTSGVTQIAASKRIHVTADGIASDPAQAWCTTNTTINGIEHRSCLVRKLAARRADKTKPRAEAIASRRAEGRVERRFDGQALELLGKAEDGFTNRFRLPLLRRGEFPRELAFDTTGDQLDVHMLQVANAQVAAPSDPPPLESGADMSVRLHETFVSNFSRAMIGGVTLTDERVAQLVKDLTGNVPDELVISPDKEPWSITFSATDPVSTQFTDKTVRFAIRGRRFTQGDNVIQSTIELSATYSLERTPAGVRLTRQGDVNVDYVLQRGTLSPAQIALRTLMRRKFESLFTPEITTEGLKLPGRWEKAGRLKLRQMDVSSGWVVLAWGIPAATTHLADARTP
jgi:hypothetical protein